MFARAFLLRVTLGAAAAVDLIVAFGASEDFFTATVARLVACFAFLDRLGFFTVRSLHGIREPYAGRERSKAKLLEPSAQISKRSNSPAPAKQVPEPEPHFPGLWEGNRLLGSRSKLPGLGKLQIPEPLPGEL